MAASSGYNNSHIVIVAAGRTPIGNLNGCLSSLRAHELGAMVIQDVLARAKISPSDVSEAIMGQVCTAGELKLKFIRVVTSWSLIIFLSCLSKMISSLIRDSFVGKISV